MIFDELAEMWNTKGYRWMAVTLTVLVLILFFVMGSCFGSITTKPKDEYPSVHLKATTIYFETEDAGTIKCYGYEGYDLVGCAKVAQ